ncbi:BTAD domain-containing putative transcriptional regulator [Nakamurella sp. GG22]
MAGSGRPLVRVDVLGPLRLTVDGEQVDVRGSKRRAVLALLAIAQGRTVTVDSLVDALWPSEAPESGRQALQSHVFRLRGQLGAAAARLQTQPSGYRLELGADELDLAQARALLTRGRSERDPAAAFTVLRQADALWRGTVLADLTEFLPIGNAAVEWAQLRRDVTDALLASGIAAGRSDEVLTLAVESLAADPLREPAVLLLMRALAGVGRPADALREGREYRQRLADETGLDPSPALSQLERDIAGGATGPGSQAPNRTARPATRIIGRETELAELRRLLGSERLVTIVGPGGVGKTRLGVEAAHRDPSHAETTTVLLAPVTDPTAIPHALAAALNLTVVQGDVLAACLAVLGNRAGLLLVDNCEHLIDEVRDTVDIVLASCPRLTVLATSREPIGLPAECVVRLTPLPLPDGEPDIARVPSVAVFLERAARVGPGARPTAAELPTVADIVRRLDGMPLAIELAAGRLSTFSLTDLQGRLDRSLDLVGGARSSGDARHRTLRSTIEWSYELLTKDEQRVFRQLAMFVDGVDVDTAERYAAELAPNRDPGDILARLVDASMIVASFEGGTRFRMLETLRSYGLDRLAAAGDADAAAQRFLRWAVQLAGWIDATMSTEQEPEADAILRRELPNLRAAWRLARDRGSLDDAAALVVALFDGIGHRDLIEIRGWAGELADDPALPTHPEATAVLGTAAEAAYHGGDYARADRLARRGLELATSTAGSWYCLTALSVADLARGAHADAVEHSIAGATVSSRYRGNVGVAALAATYAGDLERARSWHDRMTAAEVSPTMRAWSAYVAGEIESFAGHPDDAAPHYARAIDLARSSGATFLVGVATVGLLAVRVTGGHLREALTGFRDVIDYFARTGNWTHLWVTLRNLAELLRRLGDHETAALLDAAADRAPDAPADTRAPAHAPRFDDVEPVSNRDELLDAARQAIDRALRLA